MATGFIFSEKFLYHNSDSRISHFENPDRLLACMNKLNKTSYFSSLVTPELKEISNEFLIQVHANDHLRKIEISSGKRGYFDSDTPFTEKSYTAAYCAANSGIVLADYLIDGKIKNGFSLLRPPGHHAGHNKIMGFCILNNIAISARYLQNHGFRKILIIDWDVHHGNGTQEIFYKDPDIFYLSIHQFPFYPMTGLPTEKGEGKGIGATLNIPMQANSGDNSYFTQFKELIIPSIERFNPDIILISAGFDAHKHDPLGGMEITTKGFEKITQMIMESAMSICDGKVLSFLEGGYDLTALAESVETHIAVLESFS
ncbi:histone deacetylase [Leptospira sp. WS92.C1]